ncbi:SDR family oxidoreductase [bacterium 1xD8-6]|nr:SDR family oxidoreductase [bacterium D16-36]RKI68288.1 SDR family oxidoreductase [bacterium 1xD8-6]
MNILVTGAKGFIGKNLVANLYNIKEGKAGNRDFQVNEIYEYDADTEECLLDEFCAKADFVFHLAGVNRTQDQKEFEEVNVGVTSLLLEKLQAHNNKCPVMFSSSIQAALIGRYENSDYGMSKLAGERLIFDYGQKNGVSVMVYRFPNLFGKWCLPNYNSVVATFCNNIAKGLPIKINDEKEILQLVYIDDLLEEMYDALEARPHRCEYDGLQAIADGSGRYCYVPRVHKAALGEIAELLYQFKMQPESLFMPELPENSFVKKLYSTYLSYLPQKEVSFPLNMVTDDRGSFTELLKTDSCGQFSVNISKPGITKGQHWHNSKWEFFVVVSGKGLIQERKVGTDEVIEFEVSDERLEAVRMLPGYTHNIINLSKTENLVTVMWANETFNADFPDTFYEKV